MAIIRGSVPADNFTILDNDWLRDARLSWKAKGLLAYIASHRADYRLTVEQILSEATDGRDAVRAGLRELEDVGYLTRIQHRGDGGRIEGTTYLLGSTTAGNPVAGADQGERDVSAGEASDGKPGAGEPAGKNTNPQKTSEKTTSSAPPRRGTRLPEDFVVSEQMRAWYRDNVGARINGAVEHEKFLDYWRAAAGAKGVKLDWPATWRNWMRTAMERAGTAPTSGAPAGTAAAGKPRYPSAAERERARMESEQEILLAAEKHVEEHGGNPEDGAAVFAVVARIKSGELPLAGRTVMPYIEGEIVRQNGATREVTSHASD